MGALHEGHRALMRAAHELADDVVVSIFVNPLQFGAGEDFDRYPRTFANDLQVCGDEDVSLVFAPTREVMYPAGTPLITVSAGELGRVVEGVTRPGHFDGVLTVVMKLFNVVRPDVAVFGEKDAQQLAAIRRMVADLDLGVGIAGVPTVREPDGLAVSSRNRYLSPAERVTALSLSMALRAGRDAVEADAAEAGAEPGAKPAEAALRAARAVLDDAVKADLPLQLDYLVLVDPLTFTEADHGDALLAIAGRVGTTHLIDNLPVRLGPG
jgi:pantoate--beta-alanine ligase